jgi:hypothetical protein
MEGVHPFNARRIFGYGSRLDRGGGSGSCAIAGPLPPLPTPDHLHLLTQSNNMYPLAVGALFAENTIMATKQEALTLATILTIPTLLVFVLTQRFVFSGITAGAIKG